MRTGSNRIGGSKLPLACAPRLVVDAGFYSRHLRGVGMQRRAVLSSHSVTACPSVSGVSIDREGSPSERDRSIVSLCRSLSRCSAVNVRSDDLQRPAVALLPVVAICKQFEV